jgi:release factor glutamine methyltransferase
MEGWTVSHVMEYSIAILQHNSISEPEESVKQLLVHTMQLDWHLGVRQLAGVQQQTLSATQADAFRDLLQRRLRYHEPIQYLLGQWDFLDYTFQVKKPLLCPRPETEELVLKVLDDIQHHHTSTTNLRILDVGCGTGVIGIALADKLDARVEVEAIDIDPVAIQVSQHNAESILGIAAKYKALLVSAQEFCPTEPFHIVVANPPYIPRGEELEPQVRLWENEAALFAGEDGLEVIRVIVDQLPKWCLPGAICWMEVDPLHPQLIEALLQDYPHVDFEASCIDMFGKNRFVKLSVK